MSNDHNIKIIPAKAKKSKARRGTKKHNYTLWLIFIVIVYFVLLLLVAFLPLSGLMQFMSLFLGAFLIFDFHHSIKHYVKNKE